MRQKVQRIGLYQVFKQFKFDSLMFLCEFYQQKTFLYKEYLYKQGDTPDSIFLIQEGQFQFTKKFQDMEEIKNKIKLKEKSFRQRNISRQKKRLVGLQQASIYNILKPGKLNQYRIGTVSGGLGQSIGQEELILKRQSRLYNLKCVSTRNKVISIKKQHFMKVLNDNPDLYRLLRAQFKQKEKVSHKIHKNIQSTRTNMDNFVQLLQQQKQRQSVALKPINHSEVDFKLPSLNRKNLTEIRKKNSSNKLHWSKGKLNNSKQDLKIRDLVEQYDFSNQLSHEEGQGTFALTSFNSPKGGKRFDQNQKSPKSKQQESQQIHDYDDSIPLKASKSWNNRQLSPKRLLQKQRYVGMIDSSALIKQKQHILSIRRDINMNDDRIQFQQRQRHIWKQIQIDKQRGKQKNAAHSKQFMQKMLLNALRKAGYQQAIPMLTNQNTKRQNEPVESESTLEQKNGDSLLIHNQNRSLKRQKITNKLKRKKKSYFQQKTQILETSPFDECYFGKIT